MSVQSRQIAFVTTAAWILLSAGAAAQSPSEPVVPGALHVYSTMHSIGLEWDVTGDADRDAAAATEYRVRGTAAWNRGPDLLRIDYNGSNMVAGSVLFLDPGTTYDIRITLQDADGGGTARQIAFATRPLPLPAAGGRVLHVVPGAGGGDGSLASPFRGVAAASAAAQPGDTFLLHEGSYGGRVRFDRAGTASGYIVWKAAGDGEVTMAGVEVAAGYVWLEGLTIVNQTYGLTTLGAPANVVVSRCRFENNHNAIALVGGGNGWYIADNTIVGDTPATSGSFSGEGIDLRTTHTHTIAHNSITQVADGISEPGYNVDIFGNEIFDTSDDGIEPDFGSANVRMWGNRIHNAVHHAISFQPQDGAPWYIVRNQIVGSSEAAFKFRTTDRFVLVQNTIVHWGNAWPGTSMMCCNEHHLLRAFARNNLWISIQGGQIWGFETEIRDWRSDLDFDGFDWGEAADPFTYGGFVYPDVWSFAGASGLETRGIRVARSTCFADFQVPGPAPTPVPPHVMTLQPGCNAVDAGAIVPGITDGFSGSAPDLGAHEYGGATASYGPRPAGEVVMSPAEIVFDTTTVGTTSEPRQITVTNSGTVPVAIGTVGVAGEHSDAFEIAGTTCSAVTLPPGASCEIHTAFAPAAAGTFAAAVAFSSSASGTPHHIALSGTGASGDALPAPWVSQDVGAVGTAGRASHAGGTFTVSGAGEDVWGTADAFRYVFQPLDGDGAITARVAAISGAEAWTKVGVMIRATTDPASAHAFMLVSTGKGVAFQRRRSSGGLSTGTSGGAGTAPRWVRLQRAGNVIVASVSFNGGTWSEVGRDTFSMPATALAGLAVSSHDASTLATGTFDNVAVTTATSEPPLPAGWQGRDVGAVGKAGSAIESDGTFTLKGAGEDVWGTADAFHYAWRSLSDDGAIVARVASISGTEAWTKVGVMMRATTDPASAHAFMLVSAGRGVAFQRRRSSGGLSTGTSGGAGTAPRWVRLQRVGSLIVASVSADGNSWTEVGRDTFALPASVLVGLAVTSHDASVLATGAFDNVAVTSATTPPPLPVGWQGRDIGAAGTAGSAVESDGTFTIKGAGEDIWGTADAFHYAYRSLSGDGTIVARVASISGTEAWTKVGVMIRATTDPASAHAFMLVSTGKGVAFQRRRSSGGLSTGTSGGAGTAPRWVRLQRTGSLIVASVSAEGSSWTEVGRDTFTMPAAVLVGLAVSSHDASVLATGTFDNVQIATP